VDPTRSLCLSLMCRQGKIGRLRNHFQFVFSLVCCTDVGHTCNRGGHNSRACCIVFFLF
jgi:hypothetical protein